MKVEDDAEACGGGAALAGAGAGGSGAAQASLLTHASMLFMPEKLEDWTAAGLAAGADVACERLNALLG